ncbi:hypothetical protein SLS63_003343 [Diaporthe eres]|uniref:Uncharacterized protein n=1 Tax=Diaporthe eres TaxID=83184 RepID=A0ABR1PGL9_DIAER
MMTYFLSTLFISVVCANPLKSPDQPLVRARNDLEACRQAINCEIVDPQTRNETNSSLARIRYKPTMGPESMFYRDLIARQPQNHKRDDDGTIETQVTLADAKVGYGCDWDESQKHPDPHAMLGNLDQVCKSTGSCVEEESYEERIKVVDCGLGLCELQDVTWTLRGEGIYPWELQAAFVQAVQSLAGTGIESTDQEYAVKKTSPGNTDYSHCKAIKQTGEYHVSRWVWIDGNRVLQGFIVAKVSIPEEEKGAIPEIGEVIAGIFGAISAVCI